jgi:hypothetical protein
MQFRFLVRALAPVALLGSLLISGQVASPASASALPSCEAHYFSAISTVSDRPGGTTVRLVFTSSHFPTCQWSSATSYQFASSSGVAFGAKVSLANTKGLAVPQQPWLVNDTFQVTQKLETEEGVQCSQEQASNVQVTGPRGGRLLVRLPESIGVCVGGVTKWTSMSSLSFPKPSECTAAQLRLGVGQSDGTAGTIFYPLVVTNVGGHACVISGTPSVQPTTGALAGVAHILVGLAATLRDTGSTGYGDSIRLEPHAKASAAFGVVETGNFSPSQCASESFASLSVGINGVQGATSWWVPLSGTTCTKLASTNISGLVPGTTGIAPQ